MVSKLLPGQFTANCTTGLINQLLIDSEFVCRRRRRLSASERSNKPSFVHCQQRIPPVN